MLSSLTRRILGLDLGSHSLKAVELRQTWTGLEVGRMAEAPLEPGQPLADAIRALLRVHDLPDEYVVSGIAGDRLSIRRLSFPFRGRRELDQAVPFAVEEQVPFDLEDICVDWATVSGDRTHADVVATLAPRAEIARVLETLQAADLDPRVLEAEGLVLGNLSMLVDLSGTRLLLDLGHRKTTLCLCVDGRPIASRTLPVAGRALTEAVARDTGLSLADAERRKCEEGIFGSGRDAELKSALSVLDRLSRELVRTLGALEPPTNDPAAGRLEEIVICGGTAHLQRLDEYLAERTGIPTARLAFPPESHGAALLAGGDPMRFGPAVALALRGTSSAKTHMNFRRDEFAYRRDLSALRQQLRPTLWLAGLTLLLLVVSVGMRIGVESRRAAALEAQAAELYSQAFPGQVPAGSPVAAMRDAVRTAHDRADFLGVYRGNLSALDLLTEISSRVPPEVEVVLEELSIDRQVVRLRGHTSSFEAVDRLEAALAAYENFAQVRRGETQRDARREGYTFSLTISLAGDGDGL